MSFQINTIDISTNAPALAPLAGREYTSEYTSLPNANLPKAMRKDLDTIFQYLTKEELPLDENTFLIKSRDSIYFRLFGPVLKVGAEGGLKVIQGIEKQVTHGEIGGAGSRFLSVDA